jgi:HK97 family phage major capsid protein
MTMAAPVTDNRSILAKADMALADLTTSGGLLQPAQAAKFMRIMIKSSRVLGMSTVVPMRSPKQLIEKIKFGSRILRAGTEATALAAGDRAKPDLSKVELNAQLFKAEVRLDNEVLEDNIERAELRQTIMQMMAERIALDTEEVVVNGDTTSADPFLAKFDGIIKQATSHVVAAGGAISTTVLRNMLRAMPSEFLRDKRALKFLTSVNAEIKWRDALTSRQTVGGDKYIEQDVPSMYNGIGIVDVPLFPENLGGADTTNIILTDPKNVNIGIWRNIRVETDKLVSEGVLIIVATLRMDCKYAHEDAVVKATGVTTV